MMQNNESNNKFVRFLKTKGYYMLLILCLVAVGVSGYIFVSGALQEQQAVEESLSKPVTAEEPTGKTGTAQEQTGDKTTDETTEQTQTASAEAEVTEPVQGVLEETVMPVSGTVVQDYAMDHLTYNATTQDWRVHNGVDLSAPLGQAVKAARAGTVSAVYEDEYLGTTVVVQHDGGYTTHYCNLAAEVSVAAGDAVEAGQTLGTIGGTALIEVAEEAHLHFEVYCDGEPVDPAGFLY